MQQGLLTVDAPLGTGSGHEGGSPTKLEPVPYIIPQNPFFVTSQRFLLLHENTYLHLAPAWGILFTQATTTTDEEDTMTVNLHAIGLKDFSVRIKGTQECPMLELTIGDAEVNIFMHDGKAEKAMADIENAIRVFQMENGIAEGGNP